MDFACFLQNHHFWLWSFMIKVNPEKQVGGIRFIVFCYHCPIYLPWRLPVPDDITVSTWILTWLIKTKVSTPLGKFELRKILHFYRSVLGYQALQLLSLLYILGFQIFGVPDEVQFRKRFEPRQWETCCFHNINGHKSKPILNKRNYWI